MLMAGGKVQVRDWARKAPEVERPFRMGAGAFFRLSATRRDG